MFFRYALRTTDVDAARAFYAKALGLELSDGSSDGCALEAWPLHERARANGAPPHWLGLIAVAEVDAMAARFVELGAERLGPTAQARDGARFAALRDPLGAVIGLRSRVESASEQPIAWHQLHTRDLDRSWAIYSELFGWLATETIDVADPVGGHRLFTWTAGGEAVGSMANTARWPGVHPHWLFYLPVDDVEASVARVRALGGTAHDAMELRDGRCLAPCEDPQGAAFGIIAIR